MNTSNPRLPTRDLPSGLAEQPGAVSLASASCPTQTSAMAEHHDIRPDALRLVENLPAGASWDDLMYEIYVRQAIERGLADADAGHTVDHETAMARIRARIRRAS